MNGTNFAERLRTIPKVMDVTVTDDTLSVDLADGRTISVPLMWFPRLAYGTPEERANFKVAGAGYGIHWPDLDEDVGVEGLLLGKQSMESERSFAQWLAQRPQSQMVMSAEKITA
ncbi:MAG: DUF2442 domain-containing protein [Caldilineaceae bacterium]